MCETHAGARSAPLFSGRIARWVGRNGSTGSSRCPSDRRQTPKRYTSDFPPQRFVPGSVRDNYFVSLAARLQFRSKRTRARFFLSSSRRPFARRLSAVRRSLANAPRATCEVAEQQAWRTSIDWQGTTGLQLVSTANLDGHAGSSFVPFRDHYLDAVGRQHLERRRVRGNRQRVRVDAEKQRTRGPLRAAIQTDRLSDRQDVRLVEGNFNDEPRCPDVPNATRCAGTATSGISGSTP
jgi:hypothetical protein